MVEGRKRYVIMPRSGVLGPAMQSALGEEPPRDLGARAPSRNLDRLSGKSLRRRIRSPALTTIAMEVQQEGSRAAADGNLPSAIDQLAEEIADLDFTVLSQKFEDGPAMVSLSHSARLGFEAVNPGLRILPVTRYSLPRTKAPGGRKENAAQPAAGPVTQDAQVNGVVWANDYKAQLLSAATQNWRGAGVNIGVIDTGVDATHPALAGAVPVSRCLIEGEEPTAGRPVNWGQPRAARAAHGTHVAGIIAARPGHGGPEGVAPAANLLSYRIYPDSPTAEKGAENIDIINSIIAAIRDGCHVINLSFEGASLREDGVRSAITEAWNQGVICVAAAGNGFGKPVSYPAAHANCIAVSALGKRGTYPNRPEFKQYESVENSSVDPNVYLARFSNYGPQIQFAAPGHAIVSTFPNNAWWFNSGTSMASPFVAGMLARLLSGNPQVLHMLGDAKRSAAMLSLLIGSARTLRLPQRAEEGYGLPT